MSENSKIAAIIKTYNCENTIYSTLESIKELDEVYIVDEHSTDDTVEIAKEYKANIVFSSKGELLNSFNQILENTSCDWIFVIQDNEIIPNKLIYEIKKYIENPKKNKNALTIPLKTFYYDKEIKSLSKKALLRVFKKESAVFVSNFSTKIKLKTGKIHKINPNFKLKNGYILSYFENDITKKFLDIIEKNKFILKNNDIKNYSIFIKPLFAFLRQFFLKGAIFDGKFGYIISIETFIKEFNLQLMILDKTKEEK